MTPSDDQNLSLAARRTLERILAERRAELLETARRSARGPIEDVDIYRAFYATERRNLHADAEMNARLESRFAATDRRLGLLTMAISVFGLLLVLIGLFLALGLVVSEEGTSSPTSAVLATVAGLSITLLAAFLTWTFVRRARPARTSVWLPSETIERVEYMNPESDEDVELIDDGASSLKRYTFLRQWGTIEHALNDLAKQALGSDYSPRLPIRTIIDSLVSDAVLSGDAEFRLRRVLQARNEIVHREQARLDWVGLEHDLKTIASEIMQARSIERARAAEKRGARRVEDL
jgi:hypothetical protein